MSDATDHDLGRRRYDGSSMEAVERLARIDERTFTMARQQESILATLMEHARKIDSLEATRDKQVGALATGGVSVRLVALVASVASALAAVLTFVGANLLRVGV